jgi:hypothetical protein
MGDPAASATPLAVETVQVSSVRMSGGEHTGKRHVSFGRHAGRKQDNRRYYRVERHSMSSPSKP